MLFVTTSIIITVSSLGVDSISRSYFLARPNGVTLIIPAVWEAVAGGLLAPSNSRTALATWQKPIKKIQKLAGYGGSRL